LRRQRRREPYLLDSAGVSGVQSGALPVPNSGKGRSDAGKDQIYQNNNYVEGDNSLKRSPKRKAESTGMKDIKPAATNDACGILETDIDNVMEVSGDSHFTFTWERID